MLSMIVSINGQNGQEIAVEDICHLILLEAECGRPVLAAPWRFPLTPSAQGGTCRSCAAGVTPHYLASICNKGVQQDKVGDRVGPCRLAT